MCAFILRNIKFGTTVQLASGSEKAGFQRTESLYRIIVPGRVRSVMQFVSMIVLLEFCYMGA